MNGLREKIGYLTERRFHALTHNLVIAFVKIADPTRRILFASRLHVNLSSLAQQVFMRIIIVHLVRKTGGSRKQVAPAGRSKLKSFYTLTSFSSPGRRMNSTGRPLAVTILWTRNP